MNTRSSTLAVLLLGLSGCIIHVDANGVDWADSYTHSGHRVRGNGVRATENREVEAFEAVHVGGAMDVRINVGQPQRVTVRGEENVLAHLRTSVDGGTLELDLDRGDYDVEHDFVVEIGVPDLSSLTLSGTGEAWVDGLDRDEFAISLFGTGDIEVVGRADELRVALYGSGEMDLDRLHARRASVDISGSGDVRLDVSDDLAASISGSGDVSYRGDPLTNATVKGSGHVRRMRE